MSVKVWLSVSLRGATNFIVVSSLRWVGGARWPSKGWRPLSCHHRDDSENDSDFVEKFLSRYLLPRRRSFGRHLAAQRRHGGRPGVGARRDLRQRALRARRARRWHQ